MDEILTVKNLVKSYKEILAVDDISFSVKRGSLFAFLGPNGAGKSTTINVITTLLNKDSGQVMINGKTDEKYFREKIGVVFQNNVLDDVLTVKENLLYRGALYLKTKEKVLERYLELAEFLNLHEFENQRFKTLSGGQKRRTEIARALFANPEILLLDEPTTGLDPETRQIVWKVIEQLKEEKGITIFLTTHYMEEAANADHVVIINKGKIIVEGTPAFLKEKHSYDRFKIVPFDKEKLKIELKKLKKDFVKIADQFIIKVENTQDTLNLIETLKDNIKQLEVVKGSMDDVFVNVVGKDSLYV
ncbi:ABC transporter ATP-binding protein [Mariniplasma anaerobium]|uniref:ABC transporter n=1 Tax=Mariniplasma anaerobium TaxID=2735436 RepID=A0A7U9THM8_9MOLU|nr:ABC transporter ATP-binding protein [Mariniplasma anaerobium]BCR36620.1 ABC transporter [Mariniplasma anaerobium]